MNQDKHTYPSVHRGIIRAAMYLLEQKYSDIAAFYSAFDLETLVECVTYPDHAGDRQQGRGLHYYCAVTPEGKPQKQNALGFYPNGKGNYSPSPRTMFDSEYQSAVMLYYAQKQERAMESLARAAHMIADACCPPHMSDLSYVSRYAKFHKRFEGTAAETFWSEMPVVEEDTDSRRWAEIADGEIPLELFCDALFRKKYVDPENKKACKLLTTELFNAIAKESIPELPIVLGDNTEKLKECIRRRVIASIQKTAALLGAFALQQRETRPNCLREIVPYYLHQVGSKKLLYPEPIYVQFHDDGSFSLVTQEHRVLTVSILNRVLFLLESENANAKFRLGFEPFPVFYVGGDMNRLLGVKRGHLQCIDRRFYPYSASFFEQDTALTLSETSPDES